jgi:hypothetical protein
MSLCLFRWLASSGAVLALSGFRWLLWITNTDRSLVRLMCDCSDCLRRAQRKLGLLLSNLRGTFSALLRFARLAEPERVFMWRAGLRRKETFVSGGLVICWTRFGTATRGAAREIALRIAAFGALMSVASLSALSLAALGALSTLGALSLATLGALSVATLGALRRAALCAMAGALGGVLHSSPCSRSPFLALPVRAGTFSLGGL